MADILWDSENQMCDSYRRDLLQLSDTSHVMEGIVPIYDKTVSLICSALLVVCSVGNIDAKPVVLGGTGPGLNKDASFVVDCDTELGPLSPIWKPSISLTGLGSEKNPVAHASKNVVQDFAEEIGMDGGLFMVEIENWIFDNPNSTLDKYVPYFNIIRENGGRPLIRLLGTPAYLQDPGVKENNPTTFMGYPASDMEGWRDLVYNMLKYMVVSGDSVSDPNIFAGDTTPRPTLGMGDDILFAFWHGVYGPDRFQFKGTEEELFTQWDYTVQAVYQLEQDYPGIDIKIGGMAWNAMWDLNHFEPGGLVERWLEYSRDNGLTVDFVDYAFNDNAPFVLSMPLPDYPERDIIGLAHSYLLEYGFDSDTPIIHVFWESIQRVTGENSARGYPLLGNELHSHIMAALVPARLLDMELAGLTYQCREAIQDFNAGEYPLFKDVMEPYSPRSGVGIYTTGQEAGGWLGLRKPEFNAWKMVGMLKDTRIDVQSSTDYNNTVSLHMIGTKDSITGDVAILLWYYLNPFYDGNYDPVYSDLMTSFQPVGASIEVSGLDPGENYRVKKQLLSETAGNSFTNRFEIYDSILSGVSLEEINGWESLNLRMFDDRYSYDSDGRMDDIVTMEPYSILLYTIEKIDPTDVGNEGNPPMPTLDTSPLTAYQNAPNPFNPSTVISFTVNEGNEGGEIFSKSISKRPITLKIFSLRGRLVKEVLNEELPEGSYTVTWDGKDNRNQPVPSGIYLYRFSSGAYSVSRKMTLIK